MDTLYNRLDYEQLEQAANMLKAIAHPIRMSIVDLLKDDRQLTVTEIFEELDIEQAVASHHLRILKDRGVLNSKREGKNTYYFLKHNRVSQIIHCIEKCSC
ncbi:MAG: ArsR family transcriptional regulator [Gemmatimonadetes bacterium]|nr:MAG: ArsR family transcriptional regulator [Gemmatimonadota bacterium]